MYKRQPYPRAKVLDIDPAKALALPGVLAVLTAQDVPHNKVGHIQQDWDVMIAQGDICLLYTSGHVRRPRPVHHLRQDL